MFLLFRIYQFYTKKKALQTFTDSHTAAASTHTPKCIRAYIHVPTHLYPHIMQAYTRFTMPTYRHLCLHTYRHSYTHTFAYIHMHTCAPLHQRLHPACTCICLYPHLRILTYVYPQFYMPHMPACICLLSHIAHSHRHTSKLVHRHVHPHEFAAITPLPLSYLKP